MITVHKPNIYTTSNYVEYNFLIDIDGKQQSVYIQVDKLLKDNVSTLSDAALVTMLLPAMVENHELKVNGTVSEKLVNNITELQKLIVKVIPWCNIINVTFENIELEKEIEKELVVAGFSAGVDAFVTLQEYYLEPIHNDQLTHVLFNNLIYNETIAEDKFNHIKKLTDKIKLPLVKTNTNFHNLYAKKKIGFEQTHPIRNAVIAHLLSAKGIKLLYSSSFPLKDFEIKPWPDIAIVNKILLPLLSTDKTKIVDVGSEYTRVQKTKIISKIDYSYDFLDICIGKKHLKSDYYNCSQCYKCMRALVTFEKLGVLEKYNKLFDMSLYQKNKIKYLKKVYNSTQLNDVDLVRFLNGEQ